MAILLSHTTALETIRDWHLRNRLATGERCPSTVPMRPPTREELDQARRAIPALAARACCPEILIQSDFACRRKGITVNRTAQSLPQDSSLTVAPGVAVVSPEHLIVQMAPRLTDLELLVLLSELLGLYAIEPKREDGMFQRQSPVTTPERILSHLERLGPRAGVARIRHALSAACVGSGSPQETKLSLRLGLKPALGGYNLNVLSMNEPLEVERIVEGLAPGTRKPDILLRPTDPKAKGAYRGAAVEYLGKVHETPARIAADRRRRNELTALGIKEYEVDRELYKDLSYMDGLVARIRDDLGLARIGLTLAEVERRRRLRCQLYEELERIDGVHWDGRERARGAREPTAGQSDTGSWDEVPLEAYGLM